MVETLKVACGLLQATSFTPREPALEDVVEWIQRVSEGSAGAADLPDRRRPVEARSIEARRAAAEIEAGIALALAICAARDQKVEPDEGKGTEVDCEAITVARSSPPLPIAIVEFYRSMVSAQRIGSR